MYRLEKVKYKDIVNIENLSIPGGKITCVTGESGSGKTTFLKLLNRLITPESGKIYFKSNDILQLDPVALRRRAAMLPQSPVLFNGTVGENLAAGAVYSEKPMPDKEEMLSVLRRVRLNKNLDLSPENLSGGEKQRLSLARIVLQDPEVFLLDEPSSSLDRKTENLVMESVLGYIRDAGKTAVIVSHSVNFAERFADFLISIDRGVVSEVREKK